MLLSGWTKDLSLPACNSTFQSLHCIAHLREDISEVFPYLNAELGADQIIKEPPSLTFKIHGRLITLHPRRIAINALESADQAESILEWLKKSINDVWERRQEIEPSYRRAPAPKIIEILKRLPRSNCKRCGQPTCFVFATQIIEGGKTPEDCPDLQQEQRKIMASYLDRFVLS